jgi:hypothetical protein
LEDAFYVSTKSKTLIDISNRIEKHGIENAKGANPGHRIHPWLMRYNLYISRILEA